MMFDFVKRNLFHVIPAKAGISGLLREKDPGLRRGDGFIKAQKGLSLLEVLLSIAVMAVIGTGAAVVFDDWAKDRINRKVASEMKTLQETAEQYVTLNFDDVLADVPNLGNVAELDLDDLIGDGYLPPNFDARNSFNQEMKVLIRHADDDAANGSVIEVVSVTDDLNGRDSRMEDGRLFEAATAGGPKIGLISALDLGANCCDGRIQSAYGAWSVDLDDFISVYNAAPGLDGGGYMAAYGRISVTSIADQPYLYRIDIDGQPQLNRMVTNLDMNNNDIVNAGTLVADHMAVSGNGTFSGQELNSLESPYALSVRDGMQVGGNLSVLGGANDQKGDILIHGDDDAGTHDFVISGTLDVRLDNGASNGAIAAGSIFTDNLSQMNEGAFESASFSNGNVDTGAMTVTTAIVRGDIDVTDRLQTGQTQDVNTVNAANAIVGVTNSTGADATITGNLQADNALGVTGTTAVTGTINGTDQVRIETLNCGSGCP